MYARSTRPSPTSSLRTQPLLLNLRMLSDGVNAVALVGGPPAFRCYHTVTRALLQAAALATRMP